jgi:hypothetical protein
LTPLISGTTVRAMPPAHTTTLLCRANALPSDEGLAEAVPGSRVEVLAADRAGHWTRARVTRRAGLLRRGPDLDVVLERETAPFALRQARGTLVGFAERLAGRADDPRLIGINLHTRRSHLLVRAALQADDADRHPEHARLLQAIATVGLGIRADGRQIADAAGRTLIGPAGGGDPEARLPCPESARARARASASWLEALDVPLDADLPPYLADEEARLPPPEQVGLRALALWAVSSVARDAPDPIAIEAARRRGALTPRERAFVDAPHAPEADRNLMSWRTESLWTLLWALGRSARIRLPRLMVEPDALASALPDSPAALVGGATLRAPTELLDEADRTWRLRWAVAAALAKGERAPKDMDPEVLDERHHALTWLVEGGRADWDG